MTSDILDIRPARPEDKASVRRVHERAFGNRPNEADLVEELTDAGKAVVSLVAVIDGEIGGHILFSPVTLEPDNPDFRAVGLAPLAVVPEHQRIGIGSRLVHDGLDACRAIGHAAAVVLGDPGYYTRFGFTRASDFGLRNKYGADEAFMVLPLRAENSTGWSGIVKYEPEFAATEC